ncbi:MAG: hypothetical protein QOK43_2218 [Acidimicrobiaceae bacterium]|nr:hypothetical protein [Acidimicrobiaceae bacterium]
MRIKNLIAAGIGGALLVGSAWAGVGLAPVTGGAKTGNAGNGTNAKANTGAAANANTDAAAGQSLAAMHRLAVGTGATLGADEVEVGAAKVDLYPRPDATKGEVWVRDLGKCIPAGTKGVDPEAQDHVADWRSPWIENSNCLYMGGFGLGPSEPILDFDKEYGLWVRTVALRRGGQTLTLSLLDAEGYNGLYNKMCPAEKACGAIDIAKQMHDELGIDPAGVVIASTHAHSAMDFIGGWGGVPEWYMRQVAESIRQSIRQAVASLAPATLEAGDTLARGNNSERRDSYYSAEDPTLNWFRAVGRTGNVIATVGTFAAHATSFGGSATIAHADWPGVFDKTVEQQYGGMAVVFEAGLGNMSARGNNHGSMGATLASLLPPLGAGTPVKSPDVKVAQTFWDQPVTNAPLQTLGAMGFFDRAFQPTPATLQVAKPGWNRPCASASAISVRTQATAAKVGQMIITASPGEIFSNWTNTLEERSPITTLAIGQANDALGYMPQSFETDDSARQGGGFAGAGFFEYEDAYSIDRCFGDKALMTTLSMLDALNK